MHHVSQQPWLAKLFVVSSFTQILLITSLVVIFVYSANFCRKRWKWYYHSWSVPGPLALPFIGCAHKMLGNPVQRMNGFVDVMGSHPDIVRVWLGLKLLYFITKPEYIKELINRPNLIDKGDFYDFFDDVFGNGLLTSKGAKWKSHRKIMARTFNQITLDGFVGIFDKQASIFVDILKENTGKKDLPLILEMTRCHLESICETTMGVKRDVRRYEDLAEIIHRFNEILGRRVFLILYQSNFIWNHSADKKALVHDVGRVNDFCVEVVRDRMKKYEEKQGKESYDYVGDDGSTVERKVMLDFLIENLSLTQEELRDEVITILAAGTDTTASSTISILLILGLYPDVQRKVYEEVMEVLGPEKSVEPEDLPKLEYTERVIKESMRLFPVLALVARYVTEDVNIGNYVAPAGITIAFPIFHIHRNPNYWKDPMKFDPDRFLPENVAKRHPLSYIPFSAGIRNCIGWRYAMMNLITLTARIVRELKIFTEYKSLEEVEVELHVSTKIKHGPKVWFEARS